MEKEASDKGAIEARGRETTGTKGDTRFGGEASGGGAQAESRLGVEA